MKKILSLSLVGILCFTLFGCTNESKKNSVDIGNESKYMINNDLIEISLKEGNLTDTKATFIIFNHSNKTYEYGNPYLIEYKKDDVWYELKSIRQFYFTMPAIILKANESKEITIDWNYGYGKLPSGTYRIVKDVIPESDKPLKQSDIIYISAEFIIK